MENTEGVWMDVAKTQNTVAVESAQQFEEKIMKVDARDYFAIGKFQKRAESIDPNMTHPWDTVHHIGFWAENNFGTIVAGETYDPNVGQTSEEKPFGLLIAERTSDEKASSIFVKDLSQDQRVYVMDVIKTIAPCLPDEARHQFVRKIIDLAPTLKDEEVIVERLAKMFLELLPDYSNTFQSETTSQWPEVNSKLPTEKQQEQLAEFTRLVAKKIPTDRFIARMQELKQDLYFIDDPYGRGYQKIFLDMTQWVLDERKDTQRNYDILQRREPDVYSTKDKVTRPIASESELKTVLSSLIVEPMPDIKGRHRSNEVPEMVRLDDVVGGTGIETWEVSTSEGRGLPKILEFAQGFQNGSASVVGRNEPIRIIEVDGKFYVESDGRHRIAALKALGVAEVPALVTHVK